MLSRMVNPARAGMIHRLLVSLKMGDCKPRASGDDPIIMITEPLAILYTPRERG